MKSSGHRFGRSFFSIRKTRTCAAGLLIGGFILIGVLPLTALSQHPLAEPTILWAARNGEEDLVKTAILLNKDLSVTDKFGNTAVHLAAPYPEIIGLLIEAGAPINEANALGATPLHKAVRYPATVTRLLEAGANPNLRNAFGKTPKDLCQDLGSHPGATAVIKRLLEAES